MTSKINPRKVDINQKWTTIIPNKIPFHESGRQPVASSSYLEQITSMQARRDKVEC